MWVRFAKLRFNSAFSRRLSRRSAGRSSVTTYLYDQIDAGTQLVFTPITNPNGKVTRASKLEMQDPTPVLRP